MKWCLTWKSSALQLKFRGSPSHSPSVIRDEQLKSPECSMKWFWRELHNTRPQGHNYSSLLKGPAAQAGMQTPTRLEKMPQNHTDFCTTGLWFLLHGTLLRLFSQSIQTKNLLSSLTSLLIPSLTFFHSLLQLPCILETSMTRIYHSMTRESMWCKARGPYHK